MNQNDLTEILVSVRSIEKRITNLEERIGLAVDKTDPGIDPALVSQVRQPELTNPANVPPLPPRRPRPVRQPRKESAPVEEESGNLLGIIGVGCFILAMILLIRFTIEVGWLTPARQVVLAALFGGTLVFMPFFISTTDKSYLSLLPASGIVILHLTVYGAVFYHGIVSEFLGLGLISAVGFLSIWLLGQFREASYGLLAIAGTYLGAYLLKGSFADMKAVGAYLIAWDCLFSVFAVTLIARHLITFSAYAALGLVSMMALFQTNNPDLNFQLANLQMIQVLIFASATAIYSVKNRSPLSEEEAWSLLPIFLFFYGQEYYLFSTISETSATGFAFAFAAIVFLIYRMAVSRLGRKSLSSTGPVFTLLAVILYHAVFFGVLEEESAIFFGLGLMASLPFIMKLDQEKFKGPLLIHLGVLGYCMLLVFLNPAELSSHYVAIIGLVYGALTLFGYVITETSFLLFMANIQIMVAIYRFKDAMGPGFVSPAWVAFAFLLLVLAVFRKNKEVAQSALPIIFIAIGRFIFTSFISLSQGEQIIGLLVMGALIYVGGFLYKLIPEVKGSHE